MRIKTIAIIALFSLVASSTVAEEHNTGKSEKFIDELMSRMTLKEKIGQLNLPVGGDIVSGNVNNEELDGLIIRGEMGGFFNVKGVEAISRLQHLAVEKGPHGIPMLVGGDVIHGYETVFPIPLALSCSWNTAGIERAAQIAAAEATADGVNWIYSPMVDICRDPRWGRIAEGAGEDPYLGAEIAKAYVRGYQGSNIAADSTTLACVKHFALYGASEGGRDYNTVDMSLQRMFNYYLPPFKGAVDAGCASLMTSFNLVNGIHSTSSDWLIKGLLRGQWGFDGLISTDYNSIPDIELMGIAKKEEAAAMTLNAGTDMDMVSMLYLNNLYDAVKKGEVTGATINEACRRVLEAKWKLGLFEDPYRYCNRERNRSEIYKPEYRKVARQLAAETFVLLKNESNLLPLKRKGKIALIGPIADAGNNMCGTWSPLCHPEKHKSLLTAFREAMGEKAEIVYAKGSNIYYDHLMQQNAQGTRPIERGDDATLHAEALAVAAEADIIVCAMGECSDMSGESASRADITIPDTQRDLLKKLAATGKPIVLILFTGRPLVLDWEDVNIPAILNVWYPGSEGAEAIADVVFGDKSPCGKLTTTFPKSIGQIPLYYNHLKENHSDPTDGVFNRYCSNYIDCSNLPLYPFGFGLSYTQFKYGQPSISDTEMSVDGILKVSIDVTNTGELDGVEIVQLYIHDKLAQIARPVKELKHFRRVEIPAGKTVNVEFTITCDDCKYYNANLDYVCDPGEFEVMVGPNSHDTATLMFTLKK